MRVHEVMNTEPVTVSPRSSVAEAREAAEAVGARHALVIERSTVMGVLEEDRLWLSAEDVLRTAAGLQDALTDRDHQPARAAMRSAQPSVTRSDSVQTAARLMVLKGRVAIPVIDQGHLQGMLSVDECRRALGTPVQPVPSEERDEHEDGAASDDAVA
ncbi:CBS domain-containing protein [Egibacter rhizosphaerae]|uniref:CBS domain-containing protein n=1 Tax=Egibacter rhizosphaerae TaxID=1670831 RepID=A0A411YKL4_9ACTN|nr:CBS domain-containing protein [Egibacter rhizosphaerae]QBI21735.1 CBS domain-containing protein [Egibacter rhizosphaerae]